jgi:hypothetical protein
MSLLASIERVGIRYLRVDVGDFLDSTSFPATAMPCRYHTSISALAKLLDKLVFGIDNKYRVQCGEGMSLRHGGDE